MILGLIAERSRSRLDRGEDVRVGMSWSLATRDVLDSLDQFILTLSRHASYRYTYCNNLVSLPLIGVRAQLSAPVEANENALRLAGILAPKGEPVSAERFSDPS